MVGHAIFPMADRLSVAIRFFRGRSQKESSWKKCFVFHLWRIHLAQRKSDGAGFGNSEWWPGASYHSLEVYILITGGIAQNWCRTCWSSSQWLEWLLRGRLFRIYCWMFGCPYRSDRECFVPRLPCLRRERGWKDISERAVIHPENRWLPVHCSSWRENRWRIHERLLAGIPEVSRIIFINACCLQHEQHTCTCSSEWQPRSCNKHSRNSFSFFQHGLRLWGGVCKGRSAAQSCWISIRPTNRGVDELSIIYIICRTVGFTWPVIAINGRVGRSSRRDRLFWPTPGFANACPNLHLHHVRGLEVFPPPGNWSLARWLHQLWRAQRILAKGGACLGNLALECMKACYPFGDPTTSAKWFSSARHLPF